MDDRDDLMPGAGAEADVPALVRAAQSGDPAAWTELVTRFTPPLRGVAARYRLCEADVADAVQSTWATAVVRLSQLRDPAAFPGWVATVCRRESLRVIRGRSRCVPVDGHDVGVATAQSRFATSAGAEPDDPQEVVVRAEVSAVLRTLIDRLGTRERTLMSAMVAGSESYRALSDTLDMPVGSIGPTRQRAISRLREEFRRLDLLAA